MKCNSSFSTREHFNLHWTGNILDFTQNVIYLHFIQQKRPIQVTHSFCLHSTTLRSTHSLKDMSTKEIPWGVKCSWHTQLTTLPS